LLEVDNVILFCPAAYAADAWDVPFGRGFTEIIREEKSYLRNDLEALFAGYGGRSLMILGELDAVIPREVVSKYEQCLKSAARFRELVIPGCPHPIHRWSENRNEIRNGILSSIAALLDDQE
jgi:pimeloyl-ACP methyl ester carboxylesterase